MSANGPVSWWCDIKDILIRFLKAKDDTVTVAKLLLNTKNG